MRILLRLYCQKQWFCRGEKIVLSSERGFANAGDKYTEQKRKMRVKRAYVQ
jgi:hypothetical protein